MVRLKLQRSDMEPSEITHISLKVLWLWETVSQSNLHYKALREPSNRSKMKRSVPEMNMLSCADNRWKNFKRSGPTYCGRTLKSRRRDRVANKRRSGKYKSRKRKRSSKTSRYCANKRKKKIANAPSFLLT